MSATTSSLMQINRWCVMFLTKRTRYILRFARQLRLAWSSEEFSRSVYIGGAYRGLYVLPVRSHVDARLQLQSVEVNLENRKAQVSLSLGP